VGNPFTGNGQLPNGVTAYYWSVQTGAYQVISIIPVGASVWIYEQSAASVTITML
jgi:hypothetical protein